MADTVAPGSEVTAIGGAAKPARRPWEDPAARPLVRFESVTKRFGSFTAVDRLTLDIHDGEFFALLGPSGCGKTTLLRLLAGFETPSEGRVLLGGKDLNSVPPYRRPVNMMFQSYALFPHLSCVDNVAFSLKMKGVGKVERRNKAIELLRLVAMEQYAERLPAQLSGGQQQRIALARALITEPQVLLLDEPLSALDPFLRIRMRIELRRLQEQLGIVFVHVTHSQDEAMALADLVVVMNAGRIEQKGPAREIFNAPRTEFVARFIGGHNVIPTDNGMVAVRADRLALSRGNGATNARLRAVVRAVEYRGTHVEVALDSNAASDLTALLTDAVYDADPLSPGDTVTVNWADNEIHRLSPLQ